MIGEPHQPRAGTPRRTGLLFDLDGTLVQAEHLHLAAFRDLVAPTGRALSEHDFVQHVSGRSNDAIMTFLFPGADADERRDLADRKEAAWRSRAAAHGVEPTPGAVELIAWARRRGIATGLVTNAPRPNAELVVALLGLQHAFDAVLTAQDVPRGKPHPDPYLAAVQQLGLDPAATVVLEDSLPGIAAGRAAGLRVVAVASAATRAVLADSGASLVVGDLREPALYAFLEQHLGHLVTG